jgi:LCP family protein required for cell wall assembly
MVGTFDVANGTLDILSIYRDTLVDVPWEIKKINSVYNREGIEGLLEEVKDLIGFAPDYYFVVELSAVTELVDAIGGVDYDVPYNMDYDDPSQDLHIHFTAGQQHLDGADAVRLLRWRKNNSGESLSVGDIGRVEIQHSFLQSMASQAVSLGNVTKIKKIATIVDKNLTSNLSYGEMIWFGEKALGLGDGTIRFHSLPGDYTGTIWSPTYQNYQSYVFVNDTELLALVNQYLNPYTTDITSDMQHVIYGTTVNNQVSLPESTGEQISNNTTVSTQEDTPTGGQTTTERPSTATTTTTNNNSGDAGNGNPNGSATTTPASGSGTGSTTPAETTQPAETTTPAENTPAETEQGPSESQTTTPAEETPSSSGGEESQETPRGTEESVPEATGLDAEAYSADLDGEA